MQIIDGSLTIGDISLSKVGKGVAGATFRLSLTPSTIVPPNAAIQIVLASSAPQSLSANTVSFSSPSSGAAATASVAGGVLTVTLSSGTFSSGQLIAFTLPGTVTNAATAQPPLNNASVSIADVSGCILALNNAFTFRAIVDGTLGSNMPTMSLDDWTASGVGVSMSISFTPSFDIPANSSLMITLSGSAPQSLSSNSVYFVSPSFGSSSGSASLRTNGVLIVVLQSGSFASGQNIRLILPGTVTNVALPQNANNAVAAAVTDGLGIVLGESATGYIHPIVDGTLNVAINLDWRGNGTSSVTLSVFIVPHCDISSGSSIIITLSGSAPQSVSANTVLFTSPGTGSPLATASLAGGVLTVRTSSGTFSSGQLIAFSLPGTVTNAATIQPPLNNVSVSIVDNSNFTQSVNRSVFFHAIHDSTTVFSHFLSGYSTSAVGIKTTGSFRIQSAAVGNVLAFFYPSGLFVSSR
jgi:hypothetical protein